MQLLLSKYLLNTEQCFQRKEVENILFEIQTKILLRQNYKEELSVNRKQVKIKQYKINIQKLSNLFLIYVIAVDDCDNENIITQNELLEEMRQLISSNTIVPKYGITYRSCKWRM